MIQNIDRGFYSALQELNKVCKKEYAVIDALTEIDPLLLEGRELLFNKLTEDYVNSSDPKKEYAGLFAGGNFISGRSLYMKQLRLRIRHHSGDLVLIRCRVIIYRVEKWEGRQRISIPHFTHILL